MESRISNTIAIETEIENQEKPPVQAPKRLGGWLIVVAVGMSLSTFRNLSHCLFSVSSLFRQPLWDNLTNPTSTAYHPYWKPALIYEAAFNSITALLSLLML